MRRYGGDARLVRLTMNALNLKFAQFVWELRGVEKQGNAFVDMTILGSTEISQRVALSGTVGYDPMPITDTPSGLRTALTQWMFDQVDATKKRESLAALAAVDNPLTHTAETLACVACHVSTIVMPARAASAAIDPVALPGRYTSKFDLSTAGGKSAETPRTIRAFGYLERQAMISQRVVNDTAMEPTSPPDAPQLCWPFSTTVRNFRRAWWSCCQTRETAQPARAAT